MCGVRLTVKGLVQGVFFRASTCRQAERLGLCGHVSNLANGNVAIEAFGAKVDLDTLIGWCHEGPRLAQVEQVTVEWLETFSLEEPPSTFEIRY